MTTRVEDTSEEIQQEQIEELKKNFLAFINELSSPPSSTPVQAPPLLPPPPPIKVEHRHAKRKRSRILKTQLIP
jgi:hypothetical protein